MSTTQNAAGDAFELALNYSCSCYYAVTKLYLTSAVQMSYNCQFITETIGHCLIMSMMINDDTESRHKRFATGILSRYLSFNIIVRPSRCPLPCIQQMHHFYAIIYPIRLAGEGPIGSHCEFDTV